MIKKQEVKFLSGALQKAHLTQAGGENYERFYSIWSLSRSIFPIKSQELGASKPVRFLVSDQIPIILLKRMRCQQRWIWSILHRAGTWI